MTTVTNYNRWQHGETYGSVSAHERGGPRSTDGNAMREIVWRHLIAYPEADVGTLQLVAAEAGYDMSRMTCFAYRSRWRNTLTALSEAGYEVPLRSAA